MQSKFTPRSFSPISIPGLSNKSREAVNAALDAMSTRATRPLTPARKVAERSSRRWLKPPKH